VESFVEGTCMKIRKLGTLECLRCNSSDVHVEFDDSVSCESPGFTMKHPIVFCKACGFEYSDTARLFLYESGHVSMPKRENVEIFKEVYREFGHGYK